MEEMNTLDTTLDGLFPIDPHTRKAIVVALEWASWLLAPAVLATVLIAG
jgi:hypothetical protein